MIDHARDRLFTYNGPLADLDQATIPPSLDAAFQAVSIAVTAAEIWVVTRGSQWVITERMNGLSYAIVAAATGSATVHLCRDSEALGFLRVCAGRACDGVAIVAAARHRDDSSGAS